MERLIENVSCETSVFIGQIAASKPTPVGPTRAIDDEENQ
jgi:hypothetical protein